MRRIRLVCLLALVLMFSTQVVAQAALIEINPRQPVGISPNSDLVSKVTDLQKVTYPALWSNPSPDGKSMLVRYASPTSRQVLFLNVEDGSTRLVQINGRRPPTPITETAWVSNSTLIYITDLGDSAGLVTLNSNSATGTVQRIGLPGFPLSLAPNGSRMLLVALAGDSAPADAGEDSTPAGYKPLENPLVSPFNQTIPQSFSQSRSKWDEDRNVRTLSFAAPSLALLSLDLSNGQIDELYNLPEGSAVTSVGWSPNGSKLAIGRKTLPQIGRTGNYLSEQATQDGLGLLPPDKNPFFQNDFVDLMDFSQNSIRPGALKAAEGNGDSFTPNGLSWSSDGKTLVVEKSVPSRIAGRPYPIYIFNQSTYLSYYTADGKPIYDFSSDETNAPNVAIPVFGSPDELFILAARTTNVTLFYHNKATGEFRRLPIPDGSVNNFALNERTRQLVFTHSSFTQVPEIFRINWDGSGLTQLTSNNQALAAISKVRVDPVDFSLSAGQKRSGYIIQAANAEFPPKNVPLIMWQEGGPSSPYANYFSTSVESPFNLLTQFGMAILFVPLPGRDGFGPAFYNALADNRNFGQVDIDEGAEIMRQVISRGYTSQGKNGITGCSYGGFFVSQTISHYPDLYSAANSQCTLLDLNNEWMFGFTPYLSYLMGRSPSNDPTEYTKDSPFYNAYRIKTPLLIFDGTFDFLPYRIAVNFHDQVAANGTATNMVLFEGEGHGLASVHSEIIAAQAQIAWFTKYLGLS